jgi:hypothetical protein
VPLYAVMIAKKYGYGPKSWKVPPISFDKGLKEIEEMRALLMSYADTGAMPPAEATSDTVS